MRATASNDHKRAGRCRAAGFTLIEVLVVVAIIALLVAILIPSLARAREVSKRSVCASQLHQMGTAIQIYANTFKDRVPLGCYWHLAQFTYVIWVGQDYHGNAVNDYQAIGLAHKLKYLRDPQNYYCPSGRKEFGLYNSPGNLWFGPAPGTSITRMGYAMRPEVSMNGPNTEGYVSWDKLTLGQQVSTYPNLNVVPYPKLGNYKYKTAFLADLSSSMQHKNVHQDGFNISFSDSSAKWGIWLKVRSELSSMGSAGYNPNYNEVQIRMWRKFDKF